MDKSYFKLKQKRNLMLILLMISVILTNLVLHELGHLIVAKLFGANINDLSLNVLSAHISFDRNRLTNFQNSIVDISGVFFPLLISFSAINVSRKSLIFSMTALLLFIFSIISLLPFFIPMGNSDTVNLMRYSGMDQTTVSIISGLIFLSGVFFLFQNKIRNKVIHLFNSFSERYCSLEVTKYVKRITEISLFIVTMLALGNLSFLNNDVIRNFKKVDSIIFANTTKYPYKISRIQCSGSDTLIVQTRNLMADSVSITYKGFEEKEEFLILKGSGVSLNGDRFFKVVAKTGITSLTVDGMNIKGEMIVLKNK